MARSAQVQADDVENEVEEVSLRETIESARDEVIDAQAAEREPQAEGTEVPSGPVRDDSGRFTRRAPADKTGEPGDSVAAAGAQAEPQPTQAVVQGADAVNAPAGTAAPVSDLAPQGWTPAAKAQWTKLPPEIRAEVSRRETEMHRALSRQDQERTFGREFAEIANQNAAVIQRAGVSPARIFSDFLGIMNTLANGDPATKAALLRDVALRNGLDMRALVGMPQPGQAPNLPNPGAPAPAQAVIPPELRQVATEWAQFKQTQERERFEKEQREQQATLDEIVAFRAQPKARFFDAVKDQMVALLQAGAAQTLEDAYDQAIWTRPDIRSIIQTEEQAKAQAAEARRQHAQRARHKGGSVRGGSGGVASGEAPARSLREELQANFAEARSRV